MKQCLKVLAALAGLTSVSAIGATQTITFTGVVMKPPSDKELHHKNCDLNQERIKVGTVGRKDTRKLNCLKQRHELEVHQGSKSKRIKMVAIAI